MASNSEWNSEKSVPKDEKYPLFEGVGDYGSRNIDPSGEATGQGYLTLTTTRADRRFEADNSKSGIVCLLGIGMTEVSICEIRVSEGQHFKNGDEIGTFECFNIYGGSTHSVLFRKGLGSKEFPSIDLEHKVPVRSKLSVIKKI